MSYFLERLAGCSRNERVPLTGTKMTIGRSVGSSIQIISPLVSRCHAVLMFENNQWVIKDVKSINGVYVNDDKLPAAGTHVLNDKDVISLGPPDKTQFRYCYCKCIADTDTPSENERPCKIKKNEKYQSVSDTCAERDSGTLLSIDNILNHEDHLYIGAECTIFTSNESEARKPQTTDRKLPSSETDSTSEKNACQNLEDDTKATKCSSMTGESVRVTEGLHPFSEPDSENLKQTVRSLRQLLATKEREQEDLADQLLRAEAQLIEKQHEAEKKDNEIEGKSIQEKIKREVLQQVGDIMEAELICGICTELFIEATTLNCSHTFCKFCIKKWKQKKKECPICRARIKTETQALVLDNFIEKMVENLSMEVKEHRKRLTEERHNTNTKSSGSSRSDNQEAYIVISDIESEDHDSDFNDSDVSDSSVEGMPWAYYGGYGRCYNCGRRGHWANGCPDM